MQPCGLVVCVIQATSPCVCFLNRVAMKSLRYRHTDLVCSDIILFTNFWYRLFPFNKKHPISSQIWLHIYKEKWDAVFHCTENTKWYTSIFNDVRPVSNRKSLCWFGCHCPVIGRTFAAFSVFAVKLLQARRLANLCRIESVHAHMKNLYTNTQHEPATRPFRSHRDGC